MMKDKFCIYQAVTDKIISHLESGVIPWRIQERQTIIVQYIIDVSECKIID